MVRLWAIVPSKAHGLGKSRLAGILGDTDRQALVATMLAHVLDVLRAAGDVHHIAVVSPQADTFGEGINTIVDAGEGLNACLNIAVEAARLGGASHVLILPGDLPLLDVEAVEAMCAAVLKTGFAIAPDRHRRGTNALAFSTALNLSLCFGINSFPNHLACASQLGIAATIVSRPTLSFDLDDANDWQLLQSMNTEPTPARKSAHAQ